MAISTFDVSDDVQLSVRGSTVQFPDSYYVLGIFMGARCIKADNTYQSRNIDWAKAVDMAKWILEEDDWIRETYIRSIYPDDIQRYLIGNNWIKVCETSSKAVYESAYGVQIPVPTKRDCTDYLRIVREAVSILSTVEDRSFYQIISDIKKMGDTE